MILWIDAHLPPQIAPWLAHHFGRLDALPLREIGLREAIDLTIFQRAREAGAVILTKDEDFVHLVQAHGAPPQIMWVTCGNTSNARLRQIFNRAMPRAISLIEAGEPVVQIRDFPPSP